LHQNVEEVAFLIDGPPEIVALPIDRQKDLIQMPLVAGSVVPAPELIGIRLAELPAPFADGLIRHDDATGEQQFFDITVAQAEAEVELHTVTDDLDWKTMVPLVVG
jgi:hypothetical protein